MNINSILKYSQIFIDILLSIIYIWLFVYLIRINIIKCICGINFLNKLIIIFTFLIILFSFISVFMKNEKYIIYFFIFRLIIILTNIILILKYAHKLKKEKCICSKKIYNIIRYFILVQLIFIILFIIFSIFIYIIFNYVQNII